MTQLARKPARRHEGGHWRRDLRRRAIALALTWLVLAALAGAFLQLGRASAREGDEATRKAAQDLQLAGTLEGRRDSEAVGADGARALAARLAEPQNTADASYALEELRVSHGLPRFALRVGEPKPRAVAVAGQQLADRLLEFEAASVTEGQLLAFLDALFATVHGVVRVQNLVIERRLPVDDALLAQLRQGERPNVLHVRGTLRIGVVLAPAPGTAPLAGPKKTQTREKRS